MSLTVDTHIDDIALACSQVVLGLSSDSYVSTPGVAETGYISFTAAPVNNDTLTIEWNGQPLEFVFKTTPNNNGLQLPLLASGNLEDYAGNTLLPALKQNRTLYNAFTLEHNDSGPTSTGRIDLTAKATGSISLSISYTMAGSPGTTAGTDEVVQDNFAVVADIYKELTYPNKSYQLHATIDARVDSGSSVSIEMHELLKSLFGAYPLPAQAMSAITSGMDSYAKRVMIKLAEKYGTTVVVKKHEDYSKATESNPMMVLNGGYRRNEESGQTFVADHYTNGSVRKFLTKNPARECEVTDTMPTYLGYINNNGQTLTATYTLYYTDGNSNSTTLVLVSASADALYLVPCGINALSLDDVDSSKTIDYYTVQMSDDSQDTSELYTFTRDADYYRQNIVLLFKNSLGLPETFWLRGDYSRGLSTSKEVYRKPLANGFLVSDAQDATFNHRSQNTFTLNTGYYPKAIIKWLEHELLMSTEVYQIVDGEYHKIVVNTDKLKPQNEDNTLWSLEIEFTESFENVSA